MGKYYDMFVANHSRHKIYLEAVILDVEEGLAADLLKPLEEQISADLRTRLENLVALWKELVGQVDGASKSLQEGTIMTTEPIEVS